MKHESTKHNVVHNNEATPPNYNKEKLSLQQLYSNKSEEQRSCDSYWNVNIHGPDFV